MLHATPALSARHLPAIHHPHSALWARPALPALSLPIGCPLRTLAEAAEEEDLLLAARMLRLAAAILAAEPRGGLFRITYVSHATLGAQDTRDSTAAIFAIARCRNAVEGITGALVHSPSWYGQTLEGGMADLERTFARITLDSRHTDIRVLRIEAIENRGFGAWAMAEAGDAPETLLAHAATLHHCQGNTTDQALHQATGDIIAMLHQRATAV